MVRNEAEDHAAMDAAGHRVFKHDPGNVQYIGESWLECEEDLRDA